MHHRFKLCFLAVSSNLKRACFETQQAKVLIVQSLEMMLFLCCTGQGNRSLISELVLLTLHYRKLLKYFAKALNRPKMFCTSQNKSWKLWERPVYCDLDNQGGLNSGSNGPDHKCFLVCVIVNGDAIWWIALVLEKLKVKPCNFNFLLVPLHIFMDFSWRFNI